MCTSASASPRRDAKFPLWLGVAAAVALALAAAMTLWVLTRADPRSVQAMYGRICEGMTEEEVFEVMGGFQVTGATLGDGFARGNPAAFTRWYALHWDFGDSRVTVRFEKSRVTEKAIEPPPPTLLDRLQGVWTAIRNPF